MAKRLEVRPCVRQEERNEVELTSPVKGQDLKTRPLFCEPLAVLEAGFGESEDA